MFCNSVCTAIRKQILDWRYTQKVISWHLLFLCCVVTTTWQHHDIYSSCVMLLWQLPLWGKEDENLMRINYPTHSFPGNLISWWNCRSIPGQQAEQNTWAEQSRAPELHPLPPILPCNPELVKNKCGQQQKVGREKLTCCRPLNHSQHSVHDRSSEQWSAWPIAGRGKFPRINIITLPTIDFPIISWIPPFNISAFPHFSILLFSVSQFCFSSTLLFQHFSILLFSAFCFFSIPAFPQSCFPAFPQFCPWLPRRKQWPSECRILTILISYPHILNSTQLNSTVFNRFDFTIFSMTRKLNF